MTKSGSTTTKYLGTQPASLPPDKPPKPAKRTVDHRDAKGKFKRPAK
jgi:hypothetical protein